MTPQQRELADLYRTLGPVVYRRCLRLLKDAASAQDATQEVFLRLLNHPARLQQVGSALPWIYQVATRHCLNVLRDLRRKEHKHASFPLAPSATTDAFPDRQLSQAILSRFDARTQAVAVAVLVDGMEQQEVAAALGLSSKTVSRKLNRFLVNARKILERIES